MDQRQAARLGVFVCASRPSHDTRRPATPVSQAPTPQTDRHARSSVFGSLRGFNFRVWTAGGLVSNIGTWMQRIAQDWLVLTELTHHNATALGVTVALQFVPQLLFLPWTGHVADSFDRRRLLMATQIGQGLLALGLGLVTLTGVVTLWQVYVFAFALGSVSAFDAPARQVFVNELVGEGQLANAVALNSTTFNMARMIGPAIAGLLIAGVGSGWVFIVNALSFAAVLAALMLLRPGEMQPQTRHPRSGRGLSEGLRYVAARQRLLVALGMVFLMGTFGLNFSIYIPTMVVGSFHGNASLYGLLTSSFAVGSVLGALYSARNAQPSLRLLGYSSGAFGIGCALAALAPGPDWFALALVPTGFAALLFMTASNSFMQLESEPRLRGRVMALRLAVAAGATPLGSLLVGLVADHAGPRWGLGVGALAGVAGLAVGMRYRRRRRRAPA